MSDTFMVTPSTPKVQRVQIEGGGASDGAILDGASSTIKATVLDYVNSNPLAVRLTDTGGDYVAAGAGTQYTEDAAAAANPVGTVPILVRKDTPAGITTTDGDNVAQRGTDYGAAYVQLVTSAGAFIDSVGGGTQYTEDAAAAANPVGNALILVREDGLAGSLTTTDGDNVAARGNNKGELYVKHTDAIPVTQSGTWDEVGINDSGNSITVDNAQLSVVGSGTEATAMRVTIATDSTGVLSIDDNGGNISIDDGGNIITVDGTVTVTGVSTLAEQQTQTTHLATIAGDTTSIQTAAELLDNAVFVDDADFTDGTSSGYGIMGVAENTPTTVTDGDMGMIGIDPSTRAVKIHDGGNTITVDGTITANLSATDNTVLDNIDADLTTIIGHVDGVEGLLTTIDGDTGTLAGAVSGSEMQVDIVTSALPSGASTLAEQQTQTTALQLIDNSIYVDDADWTADTSSHTLVGAVTQVATTANTDGDVTPLTTNAFRELRTAIPESDLATAGTAHVKKYYTSTGAATDGIIWSPAAGKRWYVTDIFLQVSAAATVTLEDDLAGGDAAIWKAELAANSGWSHSFHTPWFSGEDAADLIITTTAGNVYVTVTGWEL